MQKFKKLLKHKKEDSIMLDGRDPLDIDAVSLTQEKAALDEDFAMENPKRIDGKSVGYWNAEPASEIPNSPGIVEEVRTARNSRSSRSSKTYEYAVSQLMSPTTRKSHPEIYPGIEEWQIMNKMGEGAFSTVYRARHLVTKEEIAIKIVQKKKLTRAQRQAILKEVNIMRHIDSPNVIKLKGFKESPDYYYVLLELAPGGELFHQIVRLTYFSEDLSRHVIIQVAHAIRHLHEECGVVHRDIKPENILFYPIDMIPHSGDTPKVQLAYDDLGKADEGGFKQGVGGGTIGVVKVADFGLSKVIWDLQTMTPCGTVGYTAPEIVRDEKYSKAVDMWALGCVLYTMLCGFPPFYDESIEALTKKVATGQYTFLSPWWDHISKSAKDLVSHLLTVDPEKRYTVNEFLNHPWITKSQEPTQPAVDAPLEAREAIIETENGSLSRVSTLFEEEREKRQRIDWTPGSASLRDGFDISYAVHRIEEEKRRRARYGSQPGLFDLEGLNEEEEDFELVGDTNKMGPPNTKKKGHFDLNISQSTILERRRQHRTKEMPVQA
ncbi:hypothetical protein CANCADRAFT_110668 [Tortispora caseinolytica NRRL Y-17796]|uniref:Protein kinase domain-containing protein n=1 Tax=Tortispora caseinolytica NRRL Y-17796 TaxID=767744 RepID=A0A1E4TGD6_9ASCO|nr:hypothetical protein CANCADRAFT_110668 [Tortispora caseinolytica NRRL Y-17796]